MFKKAVYKLLCNNWTGAIILYLFRDRIPDLRWKGYRFDITGTGMNNTIIASIFWGFYESAEIRFVEKYFKGDVDAIELGASVGILSSHIVSRFMNANMKFIGIEANSKLKKNWLENTKRKNKSNTVVTLLNAALYYDSESVQFNISPNTTESSLTRENNTQSSSITVQSVTLQKIVNEYKFTEYALFCDIEGAESGIFLNDESTLQYCKHIFIELHETEYKSVFYGVNDLRKLIEDKGFKMIDQHGPVYYFSQLPENKIN